MGELRTRGSSPRVAASAAACALTLAGALVLAGCSSPPDPKQTRDSIAKVKESPAPADALEPYDAGLHPEPLVEPVDCLPYLVITSRGTGEPTRAQLLSPVAKAISEARPDQVETLDLDYPADTDVNLGATRGVRILIDTLNVQAAACPGQRFILLGYSQGALVVGDALTQAADRLVGTAAGSLTPEAADRILAIVLYGDPRFSGAEPYDVGDFDPGLHGVLPRPTGSLEEFADRLRDYCVNGDIVCQSSMNLDEEGHVAYYSNGMQQDGAAFVIGRMPIEHPRRGS